MDRNTAGSLSDLGLRSKVITKIFGRRFLKQDGDQLVAIEPGEYQIGLPEYTTDMKEAWSVVEEMLNKGFKYKMEFNETTKEHTCVFSKFDYYEFKNLVRNGSSSKVICLAALIALGSEGKE